MGILTGDMKRVVDEQKLAGYRFKGRAVIHEPGDAAFAEGIERMRADGSKLTGRVKAIVMIEVRDAAPLVSPAYDDGVMTEADMLETPARPVRAAARTSGPRVAARMELLRTPRLLLRHWEEPDLPAFFDLYSRNDVMRWLGPHPRRALATLDEARERMGRWHDRERALDPPLGLWAIVPVPSGTEPGQPVGHHLAGTALRRQRPDRPGRNRLAPAPATPGAGVRHRSRRSDPRGRGQSEDRPGARPDRPGQRVLTGRSRSPGHVRRRHDRSLVRPDLAAVPTTSP